MQDAHHLDGAAAVLRAARRLAGEHRSSRRFGVGGIGLAVASPALTIRAIDFDNSDAFSAEVAGEARAIRSGTFHARDDETHQGDEPTPPTRNNRPWSLESPPTPAFVPRR